MLIIPRACLRSRNLWNNSFPRDQIELLVEGLAALETRVVLVVCSRPLSRGAAGGDLLVSVFGVGVFAALVALISQSAFKRKTAATNQF